jgi:hypothetical protein
MPGVLPSSPAPARVIIGSMQPSLRSISHSLNRQARSIGGQRWTLRFIYPPLTHEQLAPLFAFLVEQRGGFEKFQVFIPARCWPLRGSGGNAQVNDLGGSPTAAQLGNRLIATDGWPISTTGVLKPGDFIKFASHSKIYMATRQASSDGSGNATLQIEPAAVFELPDNDPITCGPGIPWTVARTSDTLEVDSAPRSAAAGGVYRLELEMIEAYP